MAMSRWRKRIQWKSDSEAKHVFTITYIFLEYLYKICRNKSILHNDGLHKILSNLQENAICAKVEVSISLMYSKFMVKNI